MLEHLLEQEESNYKSLKQTLEENSDEYKNQHEIFSTYRYIETAIQSVFFSKYSKLIKSRGLSLSIFEINEIHLLNDEIGAIVSENLGDRKTTPMDSILAQTETDFLSMFHSRKVKQVAAMLDNENWTQVDIQEELLEQISTVR